jgi:TonB family protein
MRSASRLLAGLLCLVLAHAAAAASKARVVERKAAEYPPTARRLGHQGTVTVSVEVLTDGSVGTTSIITSSGSPQLDEAGLKAVREWRFDPATDEDGKLIVSNAAVNVEFKLTDEKVGPGGALSDYAETTEAGRLGRIWLAYRNYRGFGPELAKRCEALGMDTQAARAANQKLDAAADVQFVTLDQKLRAALAVNGADPDRQLDDLGQRMDTDIKLRVADLFGKAAGADEQRKLCESFLAYWSSVEGSFRSNEYYERLMAL